MLQAIGSVADTFSIAGCPDGLHPSAGHLTLVRGAPECAAPLNMSPGPAVLSCTHRPLEQAIDTPVPRIFRGMLGCPYEEGGLAKSINRQRVSGRCLVHFAARLFWSTLLAVA